MRLSQYFAIALVACISTSVNAQISNIPSLETFLRDVEELAPDLQAQRSQMSVATKSVDQAGQLLNPTVAIGAWNGNANNQKWSQTDITIQQPIELGGKRSGRIEVAQSRKSLTSARYEKARAEIRTQAILFLHRLRQVLFEKTLIEEAQVAFEKLIKSYKGRPQLTPEQSTSLFLFQMAKRDYDLRRNESENEIKQLSLALKKYSGHELESVSKILPPNIRNWPDIKISDEIRSPDLEILKAENQLSKSELKLAQGQSWPTPSIGPSYTNQNQFGEQAKIWGVVFTSELPILSLNRGGRAVASENVALTEKNIKLQEAAMVLQKKSLFEQYVKQREVLKGANIEDTIHNKHQQIEKYFLKGMINSSLVIETHRQILDSQKSYHSSELSTLEKYYQILLLDGKFFEGQIL